MGELVGYIENYKTSICELQSESKSPRVLTSEVILTSFQYVIFISHF